MELHELAYVVGAFLSGAGLLEGGRRMLRGKREPKEAKRHGSGEHKAAESTVSKAEHKAAVDAAVAVEQRLGGIERGIATLTTEVKAGFTRSEERHEEHEEHDRERFDRLREDLRITRRQAGLDSQVLDVRGR